MTDDYTMGELFNDMRRESRQRRARNRENSAEILTEKGVKFTSHNGGAHLVVAGRDGAVDFWPGTGKFIARYNRKEGRGVFNLLKLCEVANGQ